MHFLSEKLPSIELDIQRCISSHAHCALRKCNVKTNLQRITPEVRFNALKQHRFYIPFDSVVCKHHFESNAWRNIENFRSLNRFDANQIADMINLLRCQDLPENDVVQDISSVDMKINTGLE